MTKQIQELFLRRTTRVKSVAFHPNLSTVITGNHCGTIYIWNYHYAEPISALYEHVGSVRTVRFHPSGDLFVSGGDDKIVRLWNYRTKEVVKEFRGHTDYIRSADFHPTKPWIVSGSDDSSIKIWNYYTGEMLCSTSGHTHYIMSVVFLDSTHLATASLDHSICLWSCANLLDQNRKFMTPGVIQIQSIEAHERGVNTLFFKDGQLYSGADDKEIRLWSYSDESLVPTRTLYSQEGNVSSVYADEGVVVGAAEDGCVSIYDKEGAVIKIEIGERCWAVSIKNGMVAIGTDNGLAMYRMGGQSIYGVMENIVYYSMNNRIIKNYLGKGTKEESFVHKINPNDSLLRIIPVEASVDRLILQYSDRYEVLESSRRVEGETGQAVVFEGSIIKLKGTTLYRNEEVLSEGVNGRIVSSKWGIFSVDGRRATICYGPFKMGGSISTSYSIVDIKATDDNLFVVGRDKISVYSKCLDFICQTDEKVEISGSCLYSTAKDRDDVFIYATARQLKYYYEGFGTLQSIDTYVIPLLMVDGDNSAGVELFSLCWTGVGVIPVNTGELKFRRAVSTGENILSVIESEHLPGLAPLKYLIAKGKGDVALPYIKDSNSRFSLFLSSNDFESALGVCDTPQMYNELAIKALENGSYDVAEQCFTFIGDCLSLFFLYLSTKQIDKMDGLIGTEVELMVKFIKEDRSLFGDLLSSDDLFFNDKEAVKKGSMTDDREICGSTCESWGDLQNNEYCEPEEDSKNSSAVVSDIYSDKDNIHLDKDKGKALEKELSSDGISVSEAETRSTDSGVFDVENSCRVFCNPADEPVSQVSKKVEELDIKNKIAMDGENNARTDECSSIPCNFNEASEESTTFSNRTSTMAVNDSESRIHIFDPSLVRDRPLEDLEAAIEEAMSLTTDGKFPSAIELFRDVISNIAQQMDESGDWLDERKKVGVYLWGLCAEVERRKLSNPERSIQFALFFSSLPLEAKHSFMAKNLAVNLCFKYGNFTMARRIAEELPKSKVTLKVLDSDKTGDKYDVILGDLCFDTFTVEEQYKTCPMCFVKSKHGDVCGACLIGLIE
ncbi:coatomer subunit alpha [Pancytospora epiphaga]|nr:coatomer subunit alpha [Pancytospora epiphaga]